MKNGTLFAVERNWFRPFEMKPLRGKKLVFVHRDNRDYYYRLKVVDEDADDENDAPNNPGAGFWEGGCTRY